MKFKIFILQDSFINYTLRELRLEHRTFLKERKSTGESTEELLLHLDCITLREQFPADTFTILKLY